MINEKTIKIPNRLSQVDSKIKEFYSKVDEFVENNKINLEKNINNKISEVQAKLIPKFNLWGSELDKIKIAKKRIWLLNPTFSILPYKPGNTEFYRASFRVTLPGLESKPMVVHLGPTSDFPEGPESPELKNLAKQKIITNLMKYYPGYYQELGISDTPAELARKSGPLAAKLKGREEVAQQNYSEVQAQYAAEMGKLEEEKMNLKNATKLFSILKPKIYLALYDPYQNGNNYIRASFRYLNPNTGKSDPKVVHVAKESLYPDWETNSEVQTLAQIKVLLHLLDRFPRVFEEFFDKSNFTF